MYHCDTCGSQVKTRAGLSGHKRFRHGQSTLANIREPGVTQAVGRDKVIALMAETVVSMAQDLTVIKTQLEQIKQRLER